VHSCRLHEVLSIAVGCCCCVCGFLQVLVRQLLLVPAVTTWWWWPASLTKYQTWLGWHAQQRCWVQAPWSWQTCGWLLTKASPGGCSNQASKLTVGFGSGVLCTLCWTRTSIAAASHDQAPSDTRMQCGLPVATAMAPRLGTHAPHRRCTPGLPTQLTLWCLLPALQYKCHSGALGAPAGGQGGSTAGVVAAAEGARVSCFASFVRLCF